MTMPIHLSAHERRVGTVRKKLLVDGEGEVSLSETSNKEVDAFLLDMLELFERHSLCIDWEHNVNHMCVRKIAPDELRCFFEEAVDATHLTVEELYPRVELNERTEADA